MKVISSAELRNNMKKYLDKRTNGDCMYFTIYTTLKKKRCISLDI